MGKNKERNEQIYILHKKGYRNKEIALMYGLDQRSISGILAPYRQSKEMTEEIKARKFQKAKVPPKLTNVEIGEKQMLDIFYQISGW